MPPRINLQPYTKACNGFLQRPSITSSASVSNPCTCSSRPASTLSAAAQRRKHDPYVIAQARQRKAANLSRQKVLREERSASVGDPVRSNPTPFIASLQGEKAPEAATQAAEGGESAEAEAEAARLNYFVSSKELEGSLDYSKEITKPIESLAQYVDPQIGKEANQRHQTAHNNAEEAVTRILQLSNGNSKDRSRTNIQRCIETFGRHSTDKSLDPKPAAVIHPSIPLRPKAHRAGPDTGSPEVQAAILTSKIQVLAKHLETTSHTDKHNKRNLRLLVHRRQKLLAYLRKKERGGPRWGNLVEKLGLAEGAWKGEISI